MIKPDELAYRDIDVAFIRSTDRAVLCVVDGDEQWIPRSLIDETVSDDIIETAERDDTIMLSIEEWKVDELGWS